MFGHGGRRRRQNNGKRSAYNCIHKQTSDRLGRHRCCWATSARPHGLHACFYLFLLFATLCNNTFVSEFGALWKLVCTFTTLSTPSFTAGAKAVKFKRPVRLMVSEETMLEKEVGVRLLVRRSSPSSGYIVCSAEPKYLEVHQSHSSPSLPIDVPSMAYSSVVVPQQKRGSLQ